MNDLLTAREVQDILKVDRTTVYRMLKDGRLRGVKMGQQWRFPSEGLVSLVSLESKPLPREAKVAFDVLPLHCIDPIQQVFAEVAGVGAITANPDGEPLTEVSNACTFCTLMMSSPSGMRACKASWRRVAQQPERRPQLVTCHAGLQYARARIELDGEFIAIIVAGQFYAEVPDHEEEAARIHRLAAEHGLEGGKLAQAAGALPVLDARRRQRLPDWLERVAHTFEDITHERADLLERLRSIAQMSTVAVR